MKHPVIILAGAVVLAGAVAAGQQPATPAQGRPVAASGILHGHADIKGDGITGTADFTESDQGGMGGPTGRGTGKFVTITLAVSGLKPGLHGVHLHAVGKCTPDFAAAGGHFDPGPAGNPDPDANHPFHMGDLPQLVVNANGKGVERMVTTRVTLSDGPLSIFDADGTAIIIHANADQGITGEARSGVSGGPRIACGVIEKR
jgi:Cu-Zn family superoxide dismutase